MRYPIYGLSHRQATEILPPLDYRIGKIGQQKFPCQDSHWHLRRLRSAAGVASARSLHNKRDASGHPAVRQVIASDVDGEIDARLDIALSLNAKVSGIVGSCCPPTKLPAPDPQRAASPRQSSRQRMVSVTISYSISRVAAIAPTLRLSGACEMILI